MISNHILGLSVNVFLHVLILLIFLTILFFTVISKKETDEIHSQAKNGIDEGIDSLLNKILKKNTNWNKIIDNMDKAEIKYKGNNPKTDKNNKTILINVIILIVMLLCIVSFYMAYITIIKKRKIGVPYILIENLFVFLILGSLEFIFFWYIIQHYIPIYPQDAEIEILEHVKSYF